MLTRTQIAAIVATLVLLSIVAGLFAGFQTGDTGIRTNVDGVSFVKTRDAGWQPEKPGDYAEGLFGDLIPEYGWALGTLPISLPSTFGGGDGLTLADVNALEALDK